MPKRGKGTGESFLIQKRIIGRIEETKETKQGEEEDRFSFIF